jgi:hypothetical protein
MSKIGIISPGLIGVTLAHVLNMSGHETFYASEGRSRRTKIRAKDFGVTDLGTKDAVFNNCDVVFSIIYSDDAAYELAQFAADGGYKGLYVDANSFSSIESDLLVEDTCKKAGMRYVEMAILAWPVYDVKEEMDFDRQIHISGEEAPLVEGLFSFDFWRVVTHEQRAKLFRRELVFGSGGSPPYYQKG